MEEQACTAGLQGQVTNPIDDEQGDPVDDEVQALFEGAAR